MAQMKNTKLSSTYEIYGTVMGGIDDYVQECLTTDENTHASQIFSGLFSACRLYILRPNLLIW